MLKSKGKVVFGLVLIFVTLSLLTGCSSGGGSDNSLVTLQGKVIDANKNPISDVKITIGEKTTESNDKGLWQIKDLKSGERSINATKKGYFNYSNKITLNSNDTYDFKMDKIIILDISTEGNGEVTKEPNKEKYKRNEKITLTAKAESEWEFSNWSGDIEGNKNPVTVTLDSTKSIKAVFVEGSSTTNQPPKLTSIGNKTIEDGKELTFIVTANDPDGDEITLSVSNLPASASFNSSTGEFTWTPNSEQVGNYEVTFIAEDGNGGTDSQDITIFVGETNTNPIANDDNFTIDEDTSLILTNEDLLSNDEDADGDTLIIDDFTYPDNGTVSENSDGSLTYTPNPDYNGSDISVYTIIDSKGGSDTANVNITINPINDIPIIDDINNQTINVGEKLNLQINAFDIDGDTVTLGVNNLPEEASFDNSTGEFNWTPTNSQIGSFTLVFTASDGKLEAKESLTIDVVDSNQAPIIETINDKRVVIENPLIFTVNANDPDGDTLNLSAIDLPNGASFDTETGQFNWTPTSSQAGNYEIEFIADDGNITSKIFVRILAGYSLNVDKRGMSGVETGSLTITPDKSVYEPNSEVILEAIPDDGYSFSGWEGPFFSLQNPIDIVMDRNKELTAVFGDGMILNVIESAYGSVEKNPDESIYTSGAIIELTATPNSGYVFDHWEASRVEGNEKIEVYVNDNIEDFNLHNTKNPLSIILRYSDINIEPIFIDENSTPTNQAPVLNSIGNKTVEEGSELLFKVTASDPDGDEITLSASGLPTGANFDTSTGEFSWIPTSEDVGNYGLTFIANDENGGTDEEAISINVTKINTNPVANDDNFTINEDTSLTLTNVDLLSNDTDDDGDTLIIDNLTYPINGTVIENSDGSITYTPNPDYNGSDMSTYTIIDGKGGSDTANVNITINPVNDIPVLDNINNKNVNEGDNLTFTVTADDPDGDEINLSASGLPTGANFDASTGEFNWTPNSEQAGNYDLSFTASDGELEDSKTVTINVSDYLHYLNINKVGDGEVNIFPNKDTYTNGETVEISAANISNDFFVGWEGDIHNTENNLTITMDSDKNLTSYFASSIQQAIDNYAIDGDSIIIPTGVYNENLDFNGKNITLSSEDPLNKEIVSSTIIDASNQGAAVIVRWGETNVELNGLTLKNGSGKMVDGEPYGGGIYVNGSSINVKNSIIENNEAKEGGGIYAVDANVKIVNTDIVNNKNFDGRGGGIKSQNSNFDISESNINSNTSLYIASTDGVTTEASDGGGIYAGNNSVFYIESSQINNNFGAGIGLQECTFTLDKVEIDSNKEFRGYGIWARAMSEVTIRNSSISNNENNGVYGNSFVNFSISNTSIFNHSTTAINALTDIEMNIVDSDIYSNYRGLFLRGDSLVASNIHVYDNSKNGISVSNLLSGEIYNSEIINNGDEGIRIASSNIQIDDSLIESNNNGLNISSTNITMNNNIVRNNEGVDGAGLNISENSTMILENTLFESNIAQNNGGGIWISTTSRIEDVDGELINPSYFGTNTFTNNSPDDIYFE